MMITPDIGIDLGTSSVQVYARGRGLILHEPAIVAVDRDSRKIYGAGIGARTIASRKPGKVLEVMPLKEGVISDFDATEKMIGYFIRKAKGRFSMRRPCVVLTVPVGISAVEKRALFQSLFRAGAGETFLVDQPRAAAMGAGLDIFKPSGTMVVDIGGGIVDVAVISMGQIVEGGSLRSGGYSLDRSIVSYLKEKNGLIIGERSAEMLKIGIGSACDLYRELKMEVRGMDVVDGKPRSIIVSSQDTAVAIKDTLDLIVNFIKTILGQTPPELSSDILDKGITFTGGGSQLREITSYIHNTTGIPCSIAEEPITCTVRGTGIILNSMDKLTDYLMSASKPVAS